MKKIKQLGMEKEFNEWAKNIKLKFEIGEKVKIIDNDLSKYRSFIPELMNNVGKIGTIRKVCKEDCIVDTGSVVPSSSLYWYPKSSLKRMRK
jgi:hypothetical protein